jgi:hypothetical protein
MFPIIENNDHLIPLSKSTYLDLVVLADVNDILLNKLNQSGTNRLALD